MSDIQFLLGNGHIKLRASRLKPIDVLQDHNGILYVVVRKVNPEVGTVGCPPPGIPPLGIKGGWETKGRKLDRYEPPLRAGWRVGEDESPTDPPIRYCSGHESM